MWTDEVGAKRYWCTGETPNMVRRQRTQFGLATDELVPSAKSAGQFELEAELLLAINRAMAGMRRRGHTLRPTSLVRRMLLDSPLLTLEIDESSAGHLLPCLTTRLRPIPARDHLDLCLAGGRVRLLGVTRRRWRAAEHRTPTGERKRLPARLMSGVLRRLPLWRGAAWLDVVPCGGELEIYWRGGPSSSSIAAILGESVCALPQAAAVAYRPSDSVRCVALSTVRTTNTVEPEWAWQEWRTATFTGPAVNEVAVRAVDVLPGVWEHEDMRDALARRDITEVFRLLERHGVAQGRIAELTGQARAEVAKIAGGREVQSYEELSRIATGLGVPPGYMGLAFDEELGRECDCADDEPAKRLRFLQHAAAVTLGVAGGKRWSPCSCELRARRRTLSA